MTPNRMAISYLFSITDFLHCGRPYKFRTGVPSVIQTTSGRSWIILPRYYVSAICFAVYIFLISYIGFDSFITLISIQSYI